jgi:hypothetical protein
MADARAAVPTPDQKLNEGIRWEGPEGQVVPERPEGEAGEGYRPGRITDEGWEELPRSIEDRQAAKDAVEAEATRVKEEAKEKEKREKEIWDLEEEVFATEEARDALVPKPGTTIEDQKQPYEDKITRYREKIESLQGMDTPGTGAGASGPPKVDVDAMEPGDIAAAITPEAYGATPGGSLFDPDGYVGGRAQAPDSQSVAQQEPEAPLGPRSPGGIIPSREGTAWEETPWQRTPMRSQEQEKMRQSQKEARESQAAPPTDVTDSRLGPTPPTDPSPTPAGVPWQRTPMTPENQAAFNQPTPSTSTSTSQPAPLTPLQVSEQEARAQYREREAAKENRKKSTYMGQEVKPREAPTKSTYMGQEVKHRAITPEERAAADALGKRRYKSGKARRQNKIAAKKAGMSVKAYEWKQEWDATPVGEQLMGLDGKIYTKTEG